MSFDNLKWLREYQPKADDTGPLKARHSMIAVEIEQLRAERDEAREKRDEWRLAWDEQGAQLRIAVGNAERYSAELSQARAQLAKYEKWFSDNAVQLANHRIGGYVFESESHLADLKQS